jgi:hypothetical protein
MTVLLMGIYTNGDEPLMDMNHAPQLRQERWQATSLREQTPLSQEAVIGRMQTH